MADLKKRRLSLIIVTGLVFIAISIAGTIIGNALGWSTLAVSAVTAFLAVSFAFAMMGRIKRLK